VPETALIKINGMPDRASIGPRRAPLEKALRLICLNAQIRS